MIQDLAKNLERNHRDHANIISPGGCRPPGSLRVSPVNTFEHVAKLGRGDRDDTVGRRRPQESSTLEALRVT
jgi:hypothetical protein